MQISAAEEFGGIIKKARKSLGLTQSDVAGASGVGLRFIVDLERGKPTCELGKALRVAMMLGVKIEAQGSHIESEEIADEQSDQESDEKPKKNKGAIKGARK